MNKNFKVVINANSIIVYYLDEQLFRVSNTHKNAINLINLLNK